MEQLFFLDIGFGDCKAVFPDNGHGPEFLKFPTAVAQAGSPRVFVDGIAREREYEFKSSRYRVAQAAARRASSTRSYDFMPSYAPLFAYCAVEQARAVTGQDVERICLGLPLAHFDRGQGRTGSANGPYRGQRAQPETRSEVPPQGYGILTDYRIGDDGTVRPGTDIDMLICDIGFNTVDICAIGQGKITREAVMKALEENGYAFA